MHKLPSKLIAIILLVSTSLSSIASEKIEAGYPPLVTTRQESFPGQVVLPKKVTLDSTEVTKYQAMTLRSQTSVMQKSAGASNATKTTLTVVAIVVVGLGVALLVITHGGKGIPVGNVGNAFAQ